MPDISIIAEESESAEKAVQVILSLAMSSIQCRTGVVQNVPPFNCDAALLFCLPTLARALGLPGSPFRNAVDVMALSVILNPDIHDAGGIKDDDINIAKYSLEAAGLELLDDDDEAEVD